MEANTIFQRFDLNLEALANKAPPEETTVRGFQEGLAGLADRYTVLRSNATHDGLSTSILVGGVLGQDFLEKFNSLVDEFRLPYQRGPTYIQLGRSPTARPDPHRVSLEVSN